MKETRNVMENVKFVLSINSLFINIDWKLI